LVFVRKNHLRLQPPWLGRRSSSHRSTTVGEIPRSLLNIPLKSRVLFKPEANIFVESRQIQPAVFGILFLRRRLLPRERFSPLAQSGRSYANGVSYRG
jgi:hypothetical protein